MRRKPSIVAVTTLLAVSTLGTAGEAQEVGIEKQGYLGSPLVEVTPFVFEGRLYRLENEQKFWSIEGAAPGARFHEDEVRIRDVATDEIVSVALENHAFATALVHDGEVYVFAGDFGAGEEWRRITRIDMTRSADLSTWTEPVTVLEAERGERIFNTAVCRGAEGFVLLYETDDRRWPSFTFKYCRNDDLADPAGWERIDGARYGIDKYVGGPALYHEDGWYYTLYLQAMPSGWETRITRSKDLREWQDAPEDRPFVTFDPGRTGLPLRPASIAERNASDVELCFFEGRTLIYFTGSDQMVAGDLQWATFDGTPGELFAGFFNEPPEPAAAGSLVEALREFRPNARQLAYQEAQLGAFIHFGPATWIGGDMHATPAAELFDPAELDAGQWADAAASFGARHVVLTAKHHNGFCLWPTETTEYSVASTPWKGGKGDVVREFVDACRARGLRPGLYLSGGDQNYGCHSTPEPMGQRHLVGDRDAYFAIFRRQLEELLTGYGPLAVLWFDGAYDPFGWDVIGGEGKALGTAHGDAIAALVHELQPSAVVFAGTRPEMRWSGSEQGWASDPLWNVVPRGEGPQHWLGPDDFGYIPAEANLHPRSGWFWIEGSDPTLASVERLLQAHDQSIGRGANLLINLTPDTRGLIPELEVRRLAELGEALRAQFGSPLARIDGRDGRGEGGILELELGSERSVDRVVVEEDLGEGQRVLSFTLEAAVDGEWRLLAEGESIGRRSIRRFDPVRTDRIRLRLTCAVGTPLIRSFAAFESLP